MAAGRFDHLAQPELDVREHPDLLPVEVVRQPVATGQQPAQRSRLEDVAGPRSRIEQQLRAKSSIPVSSQASSGVGKPSFGRTAIDAGTTSAATRRRRYLLVSSRSEARPPVIVRLRSRAQREFQRSLCSNGIRITNSTSR